MLDPLQWQGLLTSEKLLKNDGHTFRKETQQQMNPNIKYARMREIPNATITCQSVRSSLRLWLLSLEIKIREVSVTQ